MCNINHMENGLLLLVSGFTVSKLKLLKCMQPRDRNCNVCWGIGLIFISLNFKSGLTLIRAGFLVDLNSGGGGIKTSWLLGCHIVIFHPNQPNMVSNESWNVYPPIEYLKTILCFVVFPYHGPEVA